MPRVVSHREVVRRIVERTDLDALTDGVLASFSERPEFQALRPPHAELRAWVSWNIELVIRWFLHGRPPTEDELDGFRQLGRLSAEGGAPVDTVLANYRIGARFAWGALLDAADDEDRVALLDSAGLLFEFVDRVSRVFSDAYDIAARQQPAAEEAAAQALLARLARDVDLLAEDHQLAEKIGLDLGAAFIPFVVSSPGRSVGQHTTLARRLRSHRAVAATRGRRVAGLAHDPIPWPELELGADAVFAEGCAARRGEVGTALDELHAFVDVALARGHVGQVSLDEYVPDVLLHRSPRIARRLRARVYGPLEGANPELAHTLDNLIEHDFDRGGTAASLPVHRNTLTNRIQRIRVLTGVDIDCAAGRALAWLAWLERTARLADRGERIRVHRP